MNPTTGQVQDISFESPQPGFVPLPQRLHKEARKVIKTGGTVDLAGQSKLAKWARNKRKQQRKSRKANRG